MMIPCRGDREPIYRVEGMDMTRQEAIDYVFREFGRDYYPMFTNITAYGDSQDVFLLVAVEQVGMNEAHV